MNSLKHKTDIARQLSLQDWLMLAQAWWALLGFSALLHFYGFDQLANSSRGESGRVSNALLFSERIALLVELASRLHLLPMTCLTQSLALRWMLGRRGIPAQIKIGLHKNVLPVQAHAWVEVNGQALGETSKIMGRFTVLEAFDHAERLEYR